MKKEQVAVINHMCLFITWEPAEFWGVYRVQVFLGLADTGGTVFLVQLDLMADSDTVLNMAFRIKGLFQCYEYLLNEKNW